jgi:hypothetical protein
VTADGLTTDRRILFFLTEFSGRRTPFRASIFGLSQRGTPTTTYLTIILLLPIRLQSKSNTTSNYVYVYASFSSNTLLCISSLIHCSELILNHKNNVSLSLCKEISRPAASLYDGTRFNSPLNYLTCRNLFPVAKVRRTTNAPRDATITC